MVYVSLINTPQLLKRVAEHRATVWVATISYALYVIHGVLGNTWLGEGTKIVKYLKRPLLIGLTFLLAHLSTYRFEQPWIRFAKKITTKPLPSDNSELRMNP